MVGMELQSGGKTGLQIISEDNNHINNHNNN